MSVVLVHGNPETDAIWGPLRTALGRDDVIARSPPGLTETTYLEQFVLKQKQQGMQISLIGF